MGCGWNPVCHAKKAASKAWDWLTGDGAWGWLKALLIMIIIVAAIVGLVAIILGLTLLFEIAIVVLGIAALFLFIYGIATRKSTKP